MINCCSYAYKEPNHEKEVNKGGITHNNKWDSENHQFWDMNKEDDENDVDIVSHTINQILEWTKVRTRCCISSWWWFFAIFTSK